MEKKGFSILDVVTILIIGRRYMQELENNALWSRMLKDLKITQL